MKKSIIFSFVMLVIFVQFIFISCGKDNVDETQQIDQIVPVKVKRVGYGNLKRVLSLTGDIEPWKLLNVVPDIAGKVVKVYVQDGDKVRKGQLLAELDTEAAELQLKQAEAGLGVAKANYNDASRNKERMERLLQQNTISDFQLEKVKLACEAAQAQFKQANEAINLIQYRINVSKMTAPFSGFITGKYVNEGETINPMMPGGRGVVTLMDISRLKIKVNIPERNFTDIRKGLKATLNVDAFPEKIFLGVISIINPAADPMTRSFEAQITAPNPGFRLRAGMFVRVDIVVEEKKDIFVISSDAILEQDGNKYVFIAEGSKAFLRNVILGLQESDQVEIMSGLSENEQVVILGKERLKDGSAIKIEGDREK